jgi:DNA-binding response OmpR family regulator
MIDDNNSLLRINDIKEAKKAIKLLIVDDELDICDFVRNFFTERDFEVFISCDGRTAIDIVKDKNPDIVLLDMLMPVMNGMEALKKMRQIDPLLKIIVVTAVEDEEIISEAENYGIIKYMTKPLILEDLEKAVLSAVGGPDK